MSRFRSIFIAAIAAAGLTIGAAPGIAAAAQIRAPHSATSRTATSASRTSVQRPGSQVPRIPDSACPGDDDEVTIYKAGCTDATGLDSGCAPASGKMPFSPAYVFNGCGTRLWLFTADLTGSELCLDPVSGATLTVAYKYYQVSSNEDDC